MNISQHTAVQVVDLETSGPLVEAFLSRRRPCPVFLGLSIKNKMVNKRSLQVVIPWLRRYTTHTLIIVGDHLHRHNLTALRGYSPHGAIKKAMADGSRALRTAKGIIREIEATEYFTVCSAADVIETAECRSILHALSRYFAKGGAFVKDVLDSALAYATRACPELSRDDATQALPILKDYMLEELAMFIHLYQRGFLIETYLGSDLSIMRDIAAGVYYGFPFACPMRTHLGIRLAKSETLENTV